MGNVNAKTEEDCNALRSGDNPKPVFWNSTDGKCQKFKYSDEQRLGMAGCASDQLFNLSNNMCTSSSEVSSCPDGQYMKEGSCTPLPQSIFGPDDLKKMKSCKDTQYFTNGSCTSCFDNSSFNNDSNSCECSDGYSFNDDKSACVKIETFTSKSKNNNQFLMLFLLCIVLYLAMCMKQKR